MYDHFHLLLPDVNSTDCMRSKLTGLFGIMIKCQGISHLWQHLPEPRIVPNVNYLDRTVRYIALNPCRDGICEDPLIWMWSTYRDVIGATVETQNSAVRLANALGDSRGNFVARLHFRVTSDLSVKLIGTPLPKRAIPQGWTEYSIMSVLAAAAASLRVLPTEVTEQKPLRRLFLHLAKRYAWNQTSLLARICQINPRTVREIWSQNPPPGIEAAELCLGDVRLRAGIPHASLVKALATSE
jgi:hypothetical protein